MAYKTPGVYVEEIVKFPPSVAQVETAIPAFIGYTEKATKKLKNDLNLTPTRITSMLDYETYFGFAREETGITVNIVDVNTDGVQDRALTVTAPASPKPFLMYYAMQMYFANGGGPCYVVSVNTYENGLGAENSILFDEINDGLDKVRAQDEPTLLLFPDAKELSEVDFYALYGNALTQCNELQDRFTIIDTHTSSDVAVDSAALRNRISLGKDYLKYGASYYPYLNTILNYQYDEDAVIITHTTNVPSAISNASTQLQAYKSDFIEESDLLRDTGNPALGYIGVSKSIISPNLDDATIDGATLAASKVFADSLVVELESVVSTLNNMNSLRNLAEDAGNSAAASVTEDPLAVTAITDKVSDLNAFFDGTDKLVEVQADLTLAIENINKVNSKAKLKAQVSIIATALDKIYVDGSIDISTDVSTAIEAIIVVVDAGDGTDIDNGELHGRSIKSIENLDSQVYNEIKVEIDSLPIVLPPSSAMAGIYARVDEGRGVWKAPANVGVSYVVEPSVQVSHDDQKALNVDAVAGKSINAIRTFTGKGVLVWGARTLAGNDNEWRYISVRRFFNMAEESIKKATEQFVFEPNDKNTWVRVKAMIDNFLTSQWKAGALAGPTPDKAFYVSVGLGETMTAQDILEGNMIIEIGMAAVRPAEFIILKFSHKMQEA